jgi:hypothetical protein
MIGSLIDLVFQAVLLLDNLTTVFLYLVEQHDIVETLKEIVDQKHGFQVEGIPNFM